MKLWIICANLVLVQTVKIHVRQSENATKDYCAESMCPDPNSRPHLACVNDGNFRKICGEHANVFKIGDGMKRLLLREHNVYRNMVAKGKIHVLPVAERMLTLGWDDELAYMAELVAKRCTLAKWSRCLATEKFVAPGQNTVLNKFMGVQDEYKIVRAQLRAWYDEYRYVAINTLVSGKAPGGQEVGHFLQMILSLNDRIGCSIIKYMVGTHNIQLMVCVYGCSQKVCDLTYRMGRIPAEKCRCGSNPKFKNLCSPKEHVKQCGLNNTCNTDSAIDQDVAEIQEPTTEPPKLSIRKKSFVSDIIKWAQDSTVVGKVIRRNVC